MDAISRSRQLVREAFQLPGKWKNIAEAEALLSEALASDPNNTLTLTCLGTVLCDEGQYARAAELLQRAVTLGSSDRNTFFALAVATMNISTQEEARPLFARAGELQAMAQSWEAYFDGQAQ